MAENKPLVRNAADEGQVHEAKQREKRGHERDMDDVRWLLADKRGRRFYNRYLKLCGVFRSSFDNSGSVTAFNEGRRDIGLKLMADINEAAPEQYQVMLSESKENENV